MMKKFTLLLLMLFSVLGMKASRTWYNNSTGTTDEITVPQDEYLVAGEVISITFSTAAGNSISFYYHEEYDYALETAKYAWVSSGGTYEYIVNAADVDKFKTKTIKFKHNPGANPTSTVTNITVRHANQATLKNITASADASADEAMASANVSFTEFSNAKVGDIIRFNLTPNSSGYHQVLIKYVSGSGWETETEILGTTGTTGTSYDYVISDATTLKFFQGKADGIENPQAVRFYVKNNTLNSLDLISLLEIKETANPSCEAGTYEKVSLTRSLISGYNTLCLPFGATKAALGLQEDDKIYELATGSTDSSIKLSEVTSITANKPYLVYCAAARTLTSEFANLEVSASDASSTTQDDWTMYGNYTPSLSMYGKYIVYDNKIQLCGSGPYVNGLRAYFEYTGIGARESVTFDFGGETTGVQELKNSRIEELKCYYNLAGQRVDNPTKGLYIVNGKKVIIK